MILLIAWTCHILVFDSPKTAHCEKQKCVISTWDGKDIDSINEYVVEDDICIKLDQTLWDKRK